LYNDGILEVLENKKEIHFLILSQLLPGSYSIEELIEKIKEKNNKIKIIIILDEINDELKNVLVKKGVYRILNNNIEIKDILKIINEDEKMEKYNEEIKKEIEELKKYIINNNQNNNEKNSKIINNKKIKNNKKYFFNNVIILKNKIKKIINEKIKIKKIIIIKKIKNIKLFKKIIKNNKNILKNNKIISILGNNGVGKSIFSVILANYYKKFHNKILIIDFDILNNSLHTILGVNKYSDKIKNIIKNNNIEKNINNLNNENYKKINIQDFIIKINKKIDLISGINLLFDKNLKTKSEDIIYIIKKLLENYEKIIIDTTSECFFEYTRELINISDNSVFLVEGNLLELSKSKKLLDIYVNNWNINRNKINIIFNKFNKNSIDLNILKEIYDEYVVLGTIKNNENFNLLINSNFKNNILNKIKLKSVLKNF